MSFSPTFGAFGDFISLSIMVKDIVHAIGDTHGAAADYRSLACELETTDAALKQARRLSKNTIDSCQADLVLFTTQLRKYKASLGDGNGNILKRTSMKVMWLTEKDDINKFRVKLIGKAGQIILMNMLMYQDLRSRLVSLELSIERPIAEEMFTLEDAVGRVAPVPLRLVDSWDAFDALLRARFKGLQGFWRVTRKRYTLQDHRRRRYIRHDMAWKSAMLPW
ncbi:hypothetical protein PG994_005416 [Apiospora phragmitis]|uniref:Ubiquitin-like domain-containing protein n=1 Tax=Apiospora phragmitis TaxID=2905665 RepID=A0ABR1VC68_9PEZI